MPSATVIAWRPLRRSRAVSPEIRRRRLLAGLGVLVIVGAIVSAAVLTSGGEPPPATGAAAVVPSDALAYVHLSTDSSRPAVRRAITLASRFPDFPRLTAAVFGRFAGVIGAPSAPAVFARQISPWLGKEAAFAVLSTPSSTAGTLIVLDVRAPKSALAFVSSTGGSADLVYDGVQLYRYPTGAEVAFVKHYLVVGQPDSVQVAVDTAHGRSGSLQSSEDYRRAAAGEPEGRALDSYISAAGVRRLLAPRNGIVGAIGGLLYQPALTGAAISVSAVTSGLRVRVHSALDPTLVRLSGSRPSSFSPTLVAEAPAGSPLMLDLTGLDRVGSRILGAAAAAGVGTTISPLLHRLGVALQAEGVDLQSILSIFHAETAIAIVPTARAPALLIVARARNESSARDALATLQAPLAQLFPPPAAGPGQAPEWVDRQVAGVTVHQLQLGPGLQLNYAVFGGHVVVSTSIDGIADVVHPSRSLTRDSAYHAVFSGRPSRVTSLLFLDFSQLLALGEQTGLTRSARVSALRADLEKVRAVGLDSTSGESDTTAELFLQT